MTPTSQQAEPDITPPPIPTSPLFGFGQHLTMASDGTTGLVLGYACDKLQAFDILTKNGEISSSEYSACDQRIAIDPKDVQQWRNTIRTFISDDLNSFIQTVEEKKKLSGNFAVNSVYYTNHHNPLKTNQNFATKIGADPELFVRDKKGGLMPAFTFLDKQRKLGKNDPPPTPHVAEEWLQVYSDGFQAEFTTEPTQCMGFQLDRVQLGLKRLLGLARKQDSKATLDYRSVVDLPAAAWEQYEPDHFALGCAPSRNIYGEEGLRPDDPIAVRFRSAGWHMHFSAYNNASNFYYRFSQEQINQAIRMLDRVVGVGLVAFGRGMHDARRREWYGRAGEYRCGHTLEYRTPDVLLGIHPATWNLFWGLGRHAFWLGIAGMDYLWEASDSEVRQCINTYNVPLADELLRRNEPILRAMFAYNYPSFITHERFAFKALYEGARSILVDPTDLDRNWMISSEAWQPEGRHSAGMNWQTSLSTLEKGVKL